MDLATHPFILGVADRFVLNFATQVIVILILVGHDERDFLADDLAHETGEGRRILTADHPRDYVALALNRSDNADLAVTVFLLSKCELAASSALLGALFLSQCRLRSFPPT